MFGKPKPGHENEDYLKMESLVGPGTAVQGTVSTKGTLRVDGKVEGGITEAAQVIVGEDGEVQGDVTAAVVTVGGKVVGNIHASTSLEILGSAQIHGDVKTPALSIAEGATFEGNCTMTKEKHQVIEMEVGNVKRDAGGGNRKASGL